MGSVLSEKTLQVGPISIHTLNFNHSGRVDYAEIAGGGASVISRFLDVGQSQDVLADRQIVVRRQIGRGIFSPFHKWHRCAYRDASEIQRRAQHHLAHRRWWNREARCDATY